MNDEIYLVGIGTIENLRGSFSEFSATGREALTAVDNETQRVRDWLLERIRHWTQEVNDAEEAVSDAESALSSCEASGYYDEEGDYIEPDCSSEYEALAEARQHLIVVRDKLDAARNGLFRLECAVAEYNKTSWSFGRLVNVQTSILDVALVRAINDYQLCLDVRPRILLAAAGVDANRTGLPKAGTNLKPLGSDEEIKTLLASIGLLATTEVGNRLLKIAAQAEVKGKQVSFGFAELNDDILANYSREDNLIRINQNFRAASLATLAAHLAHELTHVEWFEPGSLLQEYAAFKNQCAVWLALKGNEVHSYMERRCAMMKKPMRAALKEIRKDYESLPEYFGENVNLNV